MAEWSKPAVNCYKVNVKGIFNRPRFTAAVGCIIRNDEGEWEKGCGGLIGLVDPVTAQLWSIFYGLKLAWESHRTSLVLETDCPSALGHVLHPDPRYPLADLVSMINGLRAEAWNSLELECIPESANAAASALSSHCLSGRGGVDDFVSPPASVMAIVSEEMAN